MAFAAPTKSLPAARRADADALPRHRHHSGHGPRPGRGRLRLRLHHPRRQRRPARRRQDLPAARRSRPAGQELLAVDVYDTQTRSLIQVESTIHPALASNTDTLQANDDGSYDLYFGPEAPTGKDTNWVETIPGKSWFQLFRLYGPLQPWFDQTWRLNEFEPIA